jgi:hypothetical protein
VALSLVLIRKTASNTDQYVEIDSTDVKFNETFSLYRARQGQLASGHEIPPDLTTVSAPEEPKDNNSISVPTFTKLGEHDHGEIDLEIPTDSSEQQYGRGLRPSMPRQFLLPGTSSTNTTVLLQPLPKPVNTEFQIRDQQYANFNMNVDTNEHTAFVMACLESQRDDLTILTKELELLMGCSSMDDETLAHEHGDVNLNVPDPKSQRDIDRMPKMSYGTTNP